jgi:predicted alpha/beta-fold hydrolase
VTAAPLDNGRTFRAAWWLPGRHAQTLGARALRTRVRVAFRRERLELQDGDFLDLDWPLLDSTDRNAPLVVILHGLEGSARSGYARQAYRALAAEGLAAVGVNARSCSGELNRLPRLYHSGETGDLAMVLETLASRFPGRPIGAVGFSLGGNVLLKFLGERGTKAPVHAAAAVSVPYDLASGADVLERGFARFYSWYLLRKLRRKVRAKADVLRDVIDVDRVVRTRTFWEFDGLGTARLHGFADALDYYSRSSSGQFVDRIRVPTLLLHSRDDPFLPAGVLPDEAMLRQHAWVRTRFTEHGGHVGFVSGPPWAPRFWAESTAAGFLAAQFEGGGPRQPRAG